MWTSLPMTAAALFTESDAVLTPERVGKRNHHIGAMVEQRHRFAQR